MKSPAGGWVLVSYAVSPEGQPARDAQGRMVPAWAWLATGHIDEPRFYKWNAAGEVFKWNEPTRTLEFQAVCKPRSSSVFYTGRALPPDCSPEVVDWY
jgi:hypothetical protein